MITKEILLVEDDLDYVISFKKICDKFKIHIAKSLDEAVEVLEQESIDLSIININLNKKSHGLKVAKLVRKMNMNCPIIFLVSELNKEIFEEVKEFSPINILVKSFRDFELKLYINLAMKNEIDAVNLSPVENLDDLIRKENGFFIKKREKLIKIGENEILYAEVETRYCRLITDLGQFLIQSSLSNLLDKLGDKLFFRSHRNYIFNINRVKEIIPKENSIRMDNDQYIDCSGALKEKFLKRYQVLK